MNGVEQAQVDRCRDLAEWLAEAGLHGIGALGVLDALASLGLVLTPDDDGLAGRAYWQALEASQPDAG